MTEMVSRIFLFLHYVCLADDKFVFREIVVWAGSGFLISKYLASNISQSI